MSHKALIWATRQRGLKPATKLLLIQLADHHNPVNGCFPGQELLAEECEMSVRSVREHLGILERDGLIRRIKGGGSGSRRPSDRYVFSFEDSEGAIKQADSLAAYPDRTASPEDGNTGSLGHEIPANQRNNYRQNLPPNLVIKPVREPCAGGACAAHSSNGFQEFWKAHPRPRDREASAKLFADAVRAGEDPGRIVKSAERYAAENAGNKPMYIAYSTTWLENRRWRDYPEDPLPQSVEGSDTKAAAFWASKIKAGRYVPPSAINAALAACMLSKSW